MNDPYNAQNFSHTVYPRIYTSEHTHSSISVSTEFDEGGPEASHEPTGSAALSSHQTPLNHSKVAFGTEPANVAEGNSPDLIDLPLQSWNTGADPYFDFLTDPTFDVLNESVNGHTQTSDQLDKTVSSVKEVKSIPDPDLQQRSQSDAVSAELLIHPSPNPAAVQRTVHRSALRRKINSFEPSANGSSTIRSPQLSPYNSESRRFVSFDQMATRQVGRSDDKSKSPNPAVIRQNPANVQVTMQGGQARQRSDSSSNMQEDASPDATSPQVTENRGTKVASGHPPPILPPEKVFPIQIGSDLFRLSGASISSDAPSYFTQFFEDQIQQNEETGGVRTLYIDRDPGTFKDIARHLQGYHVKPVDGTHFVKLFADAQFYSLPRLIDQLFESEIFIQIGERHFQIPKDIFSEPGNSPNFFSLGFAVFFSTPRDVFPGVDRRGLLRPPSITPPYVPGRSAETFSEILHLLRGYPLHIRNESHRSELLRDCRYFHLRGLEQKIIAHEISYNLERGKHEITLRLDDVKPSGVSFTADDPSEDDSPSPGWVSYARPFVDEKSHEMIIEISGENTALDLSDMRLEFRNLAKARVTSLFQVIANKMNLPNHAPLGLLMLSGGKKSQGASPGQTPLSEDMVKVRFDATTDIVLNGEPYEIEWDSRQGQVMARGPSVLGSESEPESDILSESASSKAGSQTASHTQERRSSTQKLAMGSQQRDRQSLTVPQTRASSSTALPAAKKRKRQSSQESFGQWIVRTGQWRLRVQPIANDGTANAYEVVFVGVKIDAYTNEKARNARKAFLG